jgi:hypothetical protein
MNGSDEDMFPCFVDLLRECINTLQKAKLLAALFPMK